MSYTLNELEQGVKILLAGNPDLTIDAAVELVMPMNRYDCYLIVGDPTNCIDGCDAISRLSADYLQEHLYSVAEGQKEEKEEKEE